MAKNYEHSKTFDVMKTIKESITGNLTSLQYLQTLDHFLWQAVEPLMEALPELYLNYLAKIVARQSLKPASKLTSGDKSMLAVHMFNILTHPTKTTVLSRKMYINRGLMFGFLSLVRLRTKEYSDIQAGVKIHYTNDLERKLTLLSIEASLDLRSGYQLYPALMQSAWWDDKARAFKAMIVEKYTRLALLQAQKTYTDFNCFIELADVVQIYLVVVNRAIDRCDARQGVLTTFLQNWFKSARSEVAELAQHQTDASFEGLVDAHGDLVHEVLGVHQPSTEFEVSEHLAYLASVADPEGLVRLFLHIPQFIPRQDREVLNGFVA